jgi:formiminotetrahydrofolate cyclodeaminase
LLTTEFQLGDKMDTTKSLQEYFNELSSSSPTPGGGNVAALCGVLASSLGMMVCNLTVGKKKYADVEEEMSALKNDLENFQRNFISFGIKDNEAFNEVMSAYKLPKNNEEEMDKRNKAILQATIGATIPPFNVLQWAKGLLSKLVVVIEKGNKNSLSDAGVAAALVGTAVKSAYLNILINCNSLSNQIVAQELRKRADISFEETIRESDQLMNKVIAAIQLH